MTLILGIETSCDETAAAVVAGGQMIPATSSSHRSTSTSAMAAFPEVFRGTRAEHSAGDRPGDGRGRGRLGRPDAVAVIHGPGLAGLLVGPMPPKGWPGARFCPGAQPYRGPHLRQLAGWRRAARVSAALPGVGRAQRADLDGRACCYRRLGGTLTTRRVRRSTRWAGQLACSTRRAEHPAGGLRRPRRRHLPPAPGCRAVTISASPGSRRPCSSSCKSTSRRATARRQATSGRPALSRR